MSAPAEDPAADLPDAIGSDGIPADAGHYGRPVVARCTKCKLSRTKRCPDDVGLERSRSSFEHVCHNCRGVTWWNVVVDPEGDS